MLQTFENQKRSQDQDLNGRTIDRNPGASCRSSFTTEITVLAGVKATSIQQEVCKRVLLEWKAKACNNEKRWCGPQNDESIFINQPDIEGLFHE